VANLRISKIEHLAKTWTNVWWYVFDLRCRSQWKCSF